MTEQIDELRDKDMTVLQHIKEGRDDVQRITQVTNLKNHHVRHSFRKLEELGLVEVIKMKGMVERVVDGQKRVFQAPLRAELLIDPDEYLGDLQNTNEYEVLNSEEISRRIQELEQEMEEMKQAIQILKRQIMERI